MNAIAEVCGLLELYKTEQLSTEDLVGKLDKIFNEFNDFKSDGYSIFVKSLIMNIDELIRFPPGKDVDYFINTLKGVEGYKLSYKSIVPLNENKLNADEIRILDIADSYCRKGRFDTEEQKYILERQKDMHAYCDGISELIELLCILCSHTKLNRYEKIYSEHCIKDSIDEKIRCIVSVFKNNGFVYCVMTYANGILQVKHIY